MATETEELLREDLGASVPEILADLRSAIEDGRDWYGVLLDSIARWRLPQEWSGGRYYRYLIGGEAFDWLLLAERLLETVADLIPPDEQEALLFRARAPIELSAEEFRQAIGVAKHRAHLNYLYGVVVEEALQLSVEEDLNKELRCRAWGHEQADESVFQRIYGRPRDALLALFREERGRPSGPMIPLPELKEFTYWLFKYRMRQCDRAKVASDTRRGLAQISRMENQCRPPKPAPAPQEPEDLIEGRAAAR
ncbi:MAG: hypothetical protein ACR2PL_20005 [Dehalococcoidia bacterium]